MLFFVFLFRHPAEKRDPGEITIKLVKNSIQNIEVIVYTLRMKNIGFVYIMTNDRNGTLYIGVTSNLVRRIQEHKQGVHDGFTKKYKLHMLVWFEQYDSISFAITREKQIKNWNRRWKLQLIESKNLQWGDLYNSLF